MPPQVVARYDYGDEDGKLLFQVERLASTDGSKGFRQRRPDGNGDWIYNVTGTRKVLFRLPEVIAAVRGGKEIFVTEGEKDALTMVSLGKVATTNPGGAQKWLPEYNEPLRGSKVRIIADRDDPGRKHAAMVAGALWNVAAELAVFEAPEPHRDVTELVEAGGSLDELVRLPLDDVLHSASMNGSGPSVNGSGPSRHVKLTPAREIRSERVLWLWRGRLPRRSLSVVAGEKGLGKSLLTNARIPAEATRGLLPGELEGQAVDVLVCSGEDDWRSVVKPRLMAHGADLDRVHRISVSDKDGESLLTLPDDVPALEAEVERLRATGRTVGMIVIDPIGAFLSGATDTHRDSSVRRALAPLAAMADRLDLVVLVVMHLTKDESTRLINRISGAGAFANAARSVLVLARSPDDPEGEQGCERVLVDVGSNWGRYAPTLAARIETREVDLDDGSRTSVGHIRITGESDISVDDLQRGRDENGGSDVDEAIGAALANGPRLSSEVKAQVVAELDCGKRSVERTAKRMRTTATC